MTPCEASPAHVYTGAVHRRVDILDDQVASGCVRIVAHVTEVRHAQRLLADLPFVRILRLSELIAQVDEQVLMRKHNAQGIVSLNVCHRATKL